MPGGTQYPNFLAGQRLTATLLGATVPIIAVKGSDETRVSTTTLANDSDLAGIALGTGTWHVQMLIYLYGGAGAIPIKTRWTFTGTWNNPLRWARGPVATNTTAPDSNVFMKFAPQNAGTDAVYGLSSSGAYSTVEELSLNVVVTAAGSLALNWAPNSSSATSGGVRSGSAVIARQIA